MPHFLLLVLTAFHLSETLHDNEKKKRNQALRDLVSKNKSESITVYFWDRNAQALQPKAFFVQESRWLTVEAIVNRVRNFSQNERRELFEKVKCYT